MVAATSLTRWTACHDHRGSQIRIKGAPTLSAKKVEHTPTLSKISPLSRKKPPKSAKKKQKSQKVTEMSSKWSQTACLNDF
jgi:hypothetical protein